MNRRDLLLATSGALACAVSGSAFGMRGGSLPSATTGAAAFGVACALIPIQRAPHNATDTREICLKRFFPSEVEGPGQLEHLSLDLQLLDDRFQPHTVYAWQLARRTNASWSGGFHMGLPGQLVSVVANLRQRGSRTTESWSGRPVIGFDSMLVTARTSTGRVPSAIELCLDPTNQKLTLADGSPRDFDALLLSVV